MGEGFGDRLSARISSTSPLCVGLDPSAALLGAWGLEDTPSGVAKMAEVTIAAVAGLAAAIKPQVAFFERHGAAGISVLEEVLAAARQAGLIVIADAKRGDIDSTMAAYGEAWLAEESPLAADALTVTAYLGFGAMGEVLAAARQARRGIFCVVASSNPEGRGLQEAVTASGASVEAALLAQLAEANAEELAAGARLGSVGAVVGATRSADHLALGSLHGPFLVPGVGAQGATPSDVGRLFAGVAQGSVLVNASRSVLAAGPTPGALVAAAGTLAEELSVALR
jgi:orotidine-5'-phosphate decarboxylase